MFLYYSDKLSAERLRLCYELAPPPVQRYLRAEIEFVRSRIRPASRVLELGCGYGRVLESLIPAASLLVGIDTSLASLGMARTYVPRHETVSLARMNAIHLAFPANSFDLVCCVQNGISAFHVDQRQLLASAVRVTGPGGTVLFSSYAPEFWNDRLDWFRIQAAHGLVGEIDESATHPGTIVCKDGFTATTVSAAELSALSEGLGSSTSITVVAESSLFCEIHV